MRLFSDSVGRKAVMAISGLMMVLFVVGHLLGNLTIFKGAEGINAYATKLHELAPVVWATRIVMGTAVVLHVFLSIQITLENRAAKPIAYAVKASRRATFASKNMIWSGLLIGSFIMYHLAHFTFRVTPDVAAWGKPGYEYQVYTMVIAALGEVVTGAVYLLAMFALFLHIWHGVQSAFQTLGLGNPKMLPRYGALAKVLSTVFLIGFGSIPAVILAGVLK